MHAKNFIWLSVRNFWRIAEDSVAGFEWKKASSRIWQQNGNEGPHLRGLWATKMTLSLLLERWGILGLELGLTVQLRVVSIWCREEAVRTRAEGWPRWWRQWRWWEDLEFGMYSENRTTDFADRWNGGCWRKKGVKDYLIWYKSLLSPPLLSPLWSEVPLPLTGPWQCPFYWGSLLPPLSSTI